MTHAHATPARRFCAQCTEEIPVGSKAVKRALGRGGALVVVCEACDPGHPSQTGRMPPAVNSTRGYTGGTGPAMNGAAVSAALRKKQGDKAYEADSALARVARAYIPPKRSKAETDIIEVVEEGKRRRRTGAAGYSSLRSSRQRTVLK